MNIRKIYLAIIFVLSASLFYQWNAENKVLSQTEHLNLAEQEGLVGAVTDDGLYAYIENDLLRIKVAISSGALVESRVEKYDV